jgi:hypothetical protein
MDTRPGDILLWRVAPGVGLIDRLVGWGESKIGETTPQGYHYFHVAFIAANPKNYYSSQPPKIDKFICPETWPSYVEQWRLKEALSGSQLNSIFQYAESRRGKLYPFISVLSCGMIQLGGLEFCSQYTEDSFAHGQILLTPDCTFATPDDIASSNVLQRIS